MNLLEIIYRGRRFKIEVYYTGAERDTWHPIVTEFKRDGTGQVVTKGEHADDRVESFGQIVMQLTEKVDAEWIDPLLMDEA